MTKTLKRNTESIVYLSIPVLSVILMLFCAWAVSHRHSIVYEFALNTLLYGVIYAHRFFFIAVIFGGIIPAVALNRFFVKHLTKSKRVDSIFKVLTSVNNKLFFYFLIGIVFTYLYILFSLVMTNYSVEHSLNENAAFWSHQFYIVLCYIIPYFWAILLFCYIEIFAYGQVKKTLHDHKDYLLSLEYQPWGRLSWWSKANRRYNARIKWINKVTENLTNCGIFVVPNEKVVIASPSANAAEYELFIGNHFRATNAVHVICSDISHVGDPVQPMDEGNFVFSYHGGIDASAIDELFKKHNYDPAHIVWDIKGYLWHYVTGEKMEKRLESLEFALIKLSEILVPGGSILIDAYPKSVWKEVMNNVLVRGFGFVWGFAERSTDGVIKELFEQSDKLNELFEHASYVGSGKYRMAVYKRKLKTES